jgi:hypothetical protein
MARSLAFAPSRAACVLVLGLLGSACGDDRYAVRDVPFCASDDPLARARLAHTYVWFARTDHEYQLHRLSDGWGAPTDIGPLRSSRVLMALVECGEAPASLSGELARDLEEGVLPQGVCEGAKLVFSTWVDAERSEQATALGYAGELHFPEVALECTAGELVQANDRTLLQRLKRFGESVDAYVRRHDKLPPDFDALAQDTGVAALPIDPWGRQLDFVVEAGAIKLMSAGPDGKPHTSDDVQVLLQTRGSRTSLTAFQGVDHAADADYDAYLRHRGVLAD